jgi:hypothetical protein
MAGKTLSIRIITVTNEVIVACFKVLSEVGKKVKLSLYRAMEAHRVVRR